MSGDVQTRQRRKEKRKQKRDDVPAIGVDTTKITESEKKNVQMHIHDDHEHGVGWCAKIVFFALMAILAGLVVLIVLENRGGSDLDTPLSESRFSEYLQGWVDETREDDHHDEPHLSAPDDDHHDDDENEEPHEPSTVPDDEPYPEEKDYSTPDDTNESEELNAELNLNESEQDEQTESQEPLDENDNQSEENQNDDNLIRDKREVDDDDDDDDDENRGDQKPDEAESAGSDNDDAPNIFEDSQPFEEERTNIASREALKGSDLERQVDELVEILNDIAKIRGGEVVTVNLENLTSKDETINPNQEDNDDDDFEDVVDNDAGEDLLLQKLAEQSEAAHQQQQQQSQEAADEPEVEESSSHRPEAEPEVEVVRREDRELLSKRRLTILTGSEEHLADDDDLDEEIIEVMMVSGPHLDDAEEMYTDSEELEEDEEFSDEGADEFGSDEVYVPKTFEDFQTLFKSQFEPVHEDPSPAEPQSVDLEMETRVERELLRKPEKPVQAESPEPDASPDEGPMSQEDDYEPEEPEELSDEEMVDEEEIDYEDEMDSEEISDIDDVDDDDLMKRLEAKYGKISGENSEEDDDPDAWTKINQEGGAQSYRDELLQHPEQLENHPAIKDLYVKAKLLDAQAEREKSNSKLVDALAIYKLLIVTHGDKLNETIFKEVAGRCIERMRFLGKLKAAVDVHKKLIERFDDVPDFRNQLAVTYLLGNHLSVAKLVLHEVLTRWRYNGFALVHYGFVLKNLDQDYDNAVLYLREGIETNEPGTQDGRFYFNLGDALQRMGRNEEAREIYKKGAKLGLFLSPYQRSLYNVDRLKSTPFWTKVQTTYKDDLMEIQKYWQIIRDEGLKLLSEEGIFANELENLKDTGDWKQLELFARGVKTKNCKLAPMTCKVIESFTAATSCKRGQVKFSVLHPDTHVFSHCGPTNCRVRCHLGLKVPDKTFIRVADETRSWKEGEWLIFDDSFEHEVWHNGTSLRLVLIVDVWHPELTESEKRNLSAI